MIYFAKSQPAPDCLENEKLKANGDYKCGCVLERLQQDFKNKCYICESKALTNINVEHFKPHRNKNIDLKFDWNNLFLSCVHCNTTKSDKFDDILNCTDLSHAVEQQLKYNFKPFPYEKVVIEAMNNNQITLNTQDLLLAVFNGTTTLKAIESDNLRKNLLMEIKDYQDCLISYDDDDKKHWLRKIKSHLNSASAFTAFKRQIIKDNSKLYQEFGQYLTEPL